MKCLNTQTQSSYATRLFDIAKEKELHGEKIYNLAAGDPSNIPICQAAQDGLSFASYQCCNYYSPAQGLYNLRKKMYPGAPDNVVITNGGKQALYMALKAVAENGEVIILGPVWSSYIEMCKMLNIKYTQILDPMSINHCPDYMEIDDACKNRVNAIIINNPCNPTGYIYPSEYLHHIFQIAEWYDCFVIYDRAYEDLNYTDKKIFNPPHKPYVIEINTLSKTYGLTGWRFGWAYCGSQEVAKAIADIQSQMSGPPSTITQTAVEYAWDKLEQTNYDILKERRDYIATISPLLNQYKPDAGLYYYLPIHINDSVKFCMEYISLYNIFMTPGDSYGVPNTVRLSFANISLEEIKEIETELSVFS